MKQLVQGNAVSLFERGFSLAGWPGGTVVKKLKNFEKVVDESTPLSYNTTC